MRDAADGPKRTMSNAARYRRTTALRLLRPQPDPVAIRSTCLCNRRPCQNDPGAGSCYQTGEQK